MQEVLLCSRMIKALGSSQTIYIRSSSLCQHTAPQGCIFITARSQCHFAASNTGSISPVKKCSILCKKCCFGNSRRLEFSPRELILAESLLNRVNAVPPDAQLQASVVYMHFCFSVKQLIMLFYMQKGFFSLFQMPWNFAVINRQHIFPLPFKVLAGVFFLFPQKSQEHVIFSFLSSLDCNIPHMSPELSHFY